MKNSIFTAMLFLLYITQVQAHEHPGIDSVTHSLEHLALSYQNCLVALAVLGFAFALLAGMRKLIKLVRSNS